MRIAVTVWLLQIAEIQTLGVSDAISDWCGGCNCQISGRYVSADIGIKDLPRSHAPVWERRCD